MDKHTLNLKLNKMQSLHREGDDATAAKIADTLSWERIDSFRHLFTAAEVYENVRNYEKAKYLLRLSYEQSTAGSMVLRRLAQLAVRFGNVQDAERYIKRFEAAAPEDVEQYLLRYQLSVLKGEQLARRASYLESFCAGRLEEKWLYELAVLYHQMGREDDCVAVCDQISLYFSAGDYLRSALELKSYYAPLTEQIGRAHV